MTIRGMCVGYRPSPTGYRSHANVRIAQSSMGWYGGIMTPEYLTAAEVADRLRVSTACVLRWIQQGKLDAVKLGYRTVRIPAQAVSDMLTTIDHGGSL